METQDFSLVDREVDWVIKKKLLDRYMAKHDLPLTSAARIARLDLAYHDIHRGRGLHYMLATGAWPSGSARTSRSSRP